MNVPSRVVGAKLHCFLAFDMQVEAESERRQRLAGRKASSTTICVSSQAQRYLNLSRRNRVVPTC